MIWAATAVRFAAKLRAGEDLIPLPNRRRTGEGKLVRYEGFLAKLVEQDRDITLREFQAALPDAHEVTSSTSGIDGLLRLLGFPYKKRASSRAKVESPM